jgi:hypothetical protein
MTDKTSPLVKEAWTGAGRRDGTIEVLRPEEDGLHIDMAKKGAYEWWYFDAHMETGHTVVVFFYAGNPNPGAAGKAGVEIVVLRPDGKRKQVFVPYSKSLFKAARDKADIKVGENRLTVTQSPGGLPVYEVQIKEKDLGCHLTYRAEVNGWKPGKGVSHFGNMGYFAWIVPFVRASVEGTITDGNQTLPVRGIGYHDHNWLDFAFPRIIDYWMWGRVYSPRYTVSFAFIQCNKKMDNHAVKVLMLADGREVVLSTGEFDFIKSDFQYSPKAKHSYPRNLAIRVPNELEVKLDVKKVLESQDMLESFNLLLRLAAKYLLRLRPGYFRLQSGFEISVTRQGSTIKETGAALHEVVLFRSAE